MLSMKVPTGASELRIEAVVIRADGRRENLGTISYWNKSPLKRAAFRIGQAMKRLGIHRS